MAEINEKGHVSVIIGSVDKSYKKARLTGKLESNDPYILEAIYKLLGACYTSLSQPNRRTLTTLYNRILTTSKNTCMPMVLAQDKKSPKHEFIQAEFLDCNTSSSSGSSPANSDNKIYYWQESDYSKTNSDVINEIHTSGFLISQPSDTLASFSSGKTITYSKVAIICFAFNNTKSTSTFNILNQFNVDITSGFTKTFVSDMNLTLFTSNNIYSNSDILFKLNKLT